MTDHTPDESPAADEAGGTKGRALARVRQRFEEALEQLKRASPLGQSMVQTDVFQHAETLMDRAGGVDALWDLAPRFEEVGVFAGGAWEDASKLQPALVAGSLQAHGVYPVVETMSELRMLAIATERATNEKVTAEEAREFLGDVMALNLELLFPAASEEERTSSGPHYESNLRLFALLADNLELASLRSDVIAEIEAVCAQRPLMTNRTRSMIATAERIPSEGGTAEEAAELTRFARAVRGPSDLAMEHQAPAAYRKVIMDLDEDALLHEAETFGRSLRGTGLSSPQHAVLLRRLRTHRPNLLPAALGLNDAGAAHFEEHAELVERLIGVAILPSTAWTIYGFAGFLERGLLGREDVELGLQRLVDLDLGSEVRKALLTQREHRDAATANAILLAGTIAVLGHPLGVGQGNNPTCQAARGISLWAQHAPGYLVQLIIAAARDGHIDMRFEGALLETHKLTGGFISQLDLELDPVQLVLVPHLDRLYDAMMRAVALRNEDGHKWVNPGLYGRWVARGFASVFSDATQTLVAEHEAFVRRFLATHHPVFNDGHPMMYPNPVGICVTNGHGRYLGPHAVSMLRVAEDPHGTLRAYFFNPNNEGRQDWGHDVKPTVQGNGEREGESSLPLEQFASRLYAFHYNPYEEGDAYAIPDESVAEISREARETWGQSFQWID